MFFFVQEAEIAALEAELAQLDDPQRLLADGVISPELEALRAENAKLKFQVTHLARVFEYFIMLIKTNLFINHKSNKGINLTS